MADVSVQNERVNGWIPSSATNVILNWPERIKTQPHDDRDNCFLPFDSKRPCGMTSMTIALPNTVILTPVLGKRVPILVPSLLAEIHNGCDRNDRHLRKTREVPELTGRVPRPQHTGQQAAANKKTKPQTEEQRRKRACAFTAGGSISKALKGLVRGVAAGTSSTYEAVDHSSDSQKLGQRRASHRSRASCARSVGRKQVQRAT